MSRSSSGNGTQNVFFIFSRNGDVDGWSTRGLQCFEWDEAEREASDVVKCCKV